MLGQRVPRVLSLAAGAGHRADGAEGRAVGVAQAPVERAEELARARVVPVLAEPHALPRAQVQLALGDGDGEGGAQEAGLHVGGHIIRSFT